MNFDTISLDAYRHGDSAARRAIAADVDRILRSTGFLAITDHGVSAQLIDDVWVSARAFFDLPLEEKLLVRPPVGDPYGYFPATAESLARSMGEEQPPDLKESFNIGPLDTPDGLDADGAAGFCYAKNYWPERPADFEQTWRRYYAAMNTLAGHIMRLFADALDLEPDWFDDKIDHAISAMRVLNYPDIGADPLPGQLRAGAHTDYGSLTILKPDEAQGGLEIYTASGNWRTVPAIPGAFIINIGDLMARWTNDRWVSTLHRVANPPADTSGSTRRQSIVFFHQPNWDAEIRCIDSCLGGGESPKYAPIASGLHLMQKFTDSVVNAEAVRG